MGIYFRLLAFLLAISTLAACTTTRNVSVRATPPRLPAPVFEPLPIRVAVWYMPELADHRAKGTRTFTRPNGDQIVTHYDIQSGDTHLIVLRQMISVAFRDVTVLSSDPNGAPEDPTVDFIVVPKIERIAYGSGADVRYTLNLMRGDGEQFANVFATGTAWENVGEDRWLEVAIRDAAAQILVRLTRNAKLDEWLAARPRSAASDRSSRS